MSERPNRLPLNALLAANAISELGNMMGGVATTWFVYQTTGSAVQTGISVVASTLPLFIMGFVGGSLVDRYSSKRIAIVSDILSGVTIAAIPALYALGVLSYPLLLVLLFFSSILDAPGGTARQSLLPDLIARSGVKPERANAAYQAIFRFAIMFGPPLGGVLTQLFDSSFALWVDAATFGVSALLIAVFAPKHRPQPKAEAGERFADKVLAGIRFVRRDATLFSMLVLFTMVDMVANSLLLVVLPVYSARVLGSAVDFGVALGGLGAGMLAGTILFGWIGHRLPQRRTIIVGMLVSSVPLCGLLLFPMLPALLVIMVLMGLGLGPCATLAMTVFQQRTPPELRGRVFGARVAISAGSIPLGAVISGALLEALGLTTAMAILVVLYLMVAVAAMVLPSLRNLDAPPTPVTPPTEPSPVAG